MQKFCVIERNRWYLFWRNHEYFGERSLLFHTHNKCLNILKGNDENFFIYAGKQNWNRENFFAWTRCWHPVLTNLEQVSDITLQKIIEKCQRIVNLKHENTRIEDISQLHAICPKVQQKKIKKDLAKPNSYFGCCGLHFKSECFFCDKSCSCCGHIEHGNTHSRTKWTKSRKNSNTRSNVNIILSRYCSCPGYST